MESLIDQHYALMDDDTEQDNLKLNSKTDIQKFFTGKSILLTGATGFMGKILVEKILRSCSDIKVLYVVVRKKRGVTQEEKMEKYFQHIVFDKIRKMNPNFACKVVTIKGDLEEENLGISESDRKLLIDEVDIIIHSGATTKFNEKISVALKINVLATKYMLELALECKHIQAFIYVSTAYSHCYNQDIEEKFYEAPADMKTVHEIIQQDTKTEQGITEEATTTLLGKWANTYTFTKSIAEDLVRQYGEKANFACGVYRPTIVVATHNEPLRGWVGNYNGPAAVFIGGGIGVLHTGVYYGRPMDLIPVDYSINSLIAATYDLPNRWKQEKRPVVYNYGSSTINPVSLNDLFDYAIKEIENIGSKYVLWMPFKVVCTNKLSFYIFHILFHFIPALFADIFLLATGQKPRCLSLFWFGTKHLDKIIYFSNGDWRIHLPEMMKVNERLSPADRKLFKFDMRDFDWEDFILWHVRGVRVYTLKDPLDNVPEMRKRFRRLKILHYTVMTAFILLFAFYIYKLLNSLLSVIF